MSIVKVNRTGTTHKIYRTNACASDEVIGMLYNNEVWKKQVWNVPCPGKDVPRITQLVKHYSGD